MKCVIGDIHGKNCWKELIDKNYDVVYFEGDYFDCYENIPAVTQVRNFREICNEARKDNRIKLCLGNHDFQYLKGIPVYEKYSGYQYYAYYDIQEALEENMDLIQPVYMDGDYLISHAGVSKTFLASLDIEDPLGINQKFLENRMVLAFNGYDSSGNNITQSCIWIRPPSLLSDKLDNYKQIVGHTRVSEIGENEGIILTDVLDTKKEVYLFIN